MCLSVCLSTSPQAMGYILGGCGLGWSLCVCLSASTSQAMGYNIQRIILGGCGLGGAYSHINSFFADSADPYGDGQGRETPRLCVH